jgi:hypothetical protein
LNDGKQGISFDRWLMRVKDIIQIAMALGAIFWGTHRFLNTIEIKDRQNIYLQTQLSELRAQARLRRG